MEKKKPAAKKKSDKAKVVGLKQLRQMKHDLIKELPEEAIRSFGELVFGFLMIVWGLPKNGKSNFVMQFVKWLMVNGKVLYIGLEEGYSRSMQQLVNRHLNDEEHSGYIEFANFRMTYAALRDKLRKKKSPRFIVIDSLQYWNITYDQYKEIKEEFPGKSFIFISHAVGKNPKGAVAAEIRYDVDVAVHVSGYVAFVQSRYGGNTPYVIWEQGAKKHWGRKYKKTISA